MAKCVVRTDLRQRPVGEPLPCVDAGEIFFYPAAHTVNECVQMLLTRDEICLGASEKRSVMLGARLVGFIKVFDAV
jgi:hypothetical protein